MDAPDRSSSSPRSRQMQGPRPPKIAVSKNSRKVKKPPVAPQQQRQLPPPVIRYEVPPKVIHIKPEDFKRIVQCLTGQGDSGAPAATPKFDAEAGPSAPPAPTFQPSPSAAFSPAARLPTVERSVCPLSPQMAPPVYHALPGDSVPGFQPWEFLPSPTAAFSPAARLPTIERSVCPLPPRMAPPAYHALPGYSVPVGLDSFGAALGPSSRLGILSPAALPPATSTTTGLFSPVPFDPSSHAWLADMSPFLPSTAGACPEPPFAPRPRSQQVQPWEFLPSPSVALSSAARLPTIERSVCSLPRRPAPPAYHALPGYSVPAYFDSFAAVPRSSSRPGILSPAALLPASSTTTGPGLFSRVPFDPSSHAWLAGMSPFLPSAAGTRPEPPFAPRPRSQQVLATPTVPSPSTSPSSSSSSTTTRTRKSSSE